MSKNFGLKKVDLPISSNKIGNLYFSGLKQIANEAKIKEANISLVVSVMNPEKTQVNFHKNKKKNQSFECFIIPVEDLETSDISRYFHEATIRIANFIFSKKNVLVHCENGHSRAPTIIIAFMIRYFWMYFEKSLDILNTIDEEVSPNLGFRIQLKEYEKFLLIKNKLSNPSSFPKLEEIRERVKTEFQKLNDQKKSFVVTANESSEMKSEFALKLPSFKSIKDEGNNNILTVSKGDIKMIK